MIRNDEQWLGVADAFHAAAFDERGWYPALEQLAVTTGSRGGELITFGADATVPMHLMTGVDPDLIPAFEAGGGCTPEFNPRVKAGFAAPALQVLAEADFLTPDEHKHHPHYREFARPWDIPFICLTTLDRTDNLLIGLAVVRSERQGHINSEQRRVFASIAPHVRAAVRTQMALENKGPALLAGALEALSIAAFICDGSGNVRAMTPSAEALVGDGRTLRLKQRRLQAQSHEDTRALENAIDTATNGLFRPAHPVMKTVLIRSAHTPLVLEVVSLPRREWEFGFPVRALVVVRGPRNTQARKMAILQTAYRLTPAEVEIALQIADGRTAEAIAASRGVAIGTVRSQIKAIFPKLGVTRQLELVACINQL